MDNLERFYIFLESENYAGLSETLGEWIDKWSFEQNISITLDQRRLLVYYSQVRIEYLVRTYSINYVDLYKKFVLYEMFNEILNLKVHCLT